MRFTATQSTGTIQFAQTTAAATLMLDQILIAPTTSPLVSEVPLVAGAYYYRHEFSYAGDPAHTVLSLRHFWDDGAIVYLNGQELTRVNLPDGAVSHETLAPIAIGDPSWSTPLTFDGSLLRKGRNVIAVEVHPAKISDTDMAFGLELTATETPVPPDQVRVGVVINELERVGAPVQLIELFNGGDVPVLLSSLQLRVRDTLAVLPDEMLAVGGFATVQVDVEPNPSDLIVLSELTTGDVLDAMHAAPTRLARVPDGVGAFYNEAEMSLGAANQVPLEDAIVINEIMYHAPPRYALPAEPPTFAAQPLVKLDAVWRYNDTGEALPTGWAQTTHAIGGNWNSGPGLLGFETGPVIEPGIGTTLAGSKFTYYFETDFEVTAAMLAATDEFQFQHAIDDGAIFYLNGSEVYRFNMPEGDVTSTTRSNTAINNAELSSIVPLAKEAFQVGVNRLSVEVHQSSLASSDMIFGALLLAAQIVDPALPPTPFVENEREWIELYNRSDREVDLGHWALANAIEYEFPSGTKMGPGDYLLVTNDPASLRDDYPAAKIVGPFRGQLANSNEHIRL
ncbi:MAG: lamin tail domain-containing protein, partial [Planctomycetales bacterium]|nr:lamin tail domain-containing protein [Planctomycetales bacterium]